MEFGNLDAKGAGKVWLDGPFRRQKGADFKPINAVGSLRRTGEDVAPQEEEEGEQGQQSILYQFLHICVADDGVNTIPMKR